MFIIVLGDKVTQKELLYFEDAVGHENNIIKICSESINYLEDDKLKDFMSSQINEHKTRKDKLMQYLKESANE